MFGMEETNMANIVDGVSHVCRQLTLKTDDSTYLKYLNQYLNYDVNNNEKKTLVKKL